MESGVLTTMHNTTPTWVEPPYGFKCILYFSMDTDEIVDPHFGFFFNVLFSPHCALLVRGYLSYTHFWFFVFYNIIISNCLSQQYNNLYNSILFIHIIILYYCRL